MSKGIFFFFIEKHHKCSTCYEIICLSPLTIIYMSSQTRCHEESGKGCDFGSLLTLMSVFLKWASCMYKRNCSFRNSCSGFSTPPWWLSLSYSTNNIHHTHIQTRLLCLRRSEVKSGHDIIWEIQTILVLKLMEIRLPQRPGWDLWWITSNTHTVTDSRALTNTNPLNPPTVTLHWLSFDHNTTEPCVYYTHYCPAGNIFSLLMVTAC